MNFENADDPRKLLIFTKSWVHLQKYSWKLSLTIAASVLQEIGRMFAQLLKTIISHAVYLLIGITHYYLHIDAVGKTLCRCTKTFEFKDDGTR